MLPDPPDLFVGRAADLAGLDALLSERPLVTVVGPAGVGKTRLAIEAVRRAAPAFADGAAFVGLADVRSPEMFPSALAGALGIVDLGARPPLELVADHLRGREFLLLLDNLEQIVEVGATIASLLVECPRLKVLATSRRALDLRSEHCYHLEPLSLPRTDSADAEASLGSDAVALLIARLSALDQRFQATAADVVLIARMCRRLDGLPLALELAAARTRTLSLPELLSALERSLPLLTNGPRDMPARQRTMTDALAWSWQLLSANAAAVLARLGVAAGGADILAITALVDDLGLDEVAILDALDELLSHSLVRREDVAGTTRFRLLEVVREFAVGQLTPRDFARTREAHATHFLSVAAAVAPGLDGPDQAVLLDRLQRDGPNFVAAVRSAVATGDAEVALRLCVALRFLWYVRGSLSDGRALFADALAVPGAPASVHAKALVEASALARCQGAYAEAAEMLERALALVGDSNPRALAGTLLQVGFVAHLVGEYDRARAALEQCLRLRRAEGDRLGSARALQHLALVEGIEGGDLQLAWDMEVECLEIYRELGNARHVATVLIAITDLARACGDLAAAREAMAEALGHIDQLADIPLLVHALHYAAALTADEGHLNRALRLLGAAEGLASRSGALAWPAVARSTERWMGSAVQALGRPRAERLRASGADLGFREAIALATADGAEASLLTRREYEIASLVAEGLSNRLIAARLVLSERTVDGHVARILTKLDMRTRSQIAVWITDSEAGRTRTQVR